MAKATFEYDLTDADDIREHLCATLSPTMAMFIWELKHNILRNAGKNELHSGEIIQLIYEHIDNLGFDIDDLIV